MEEVCALSGKDTWEVGRVEFFVLCIGYARGDRKRVVSVLAGWLSIEVLEVQVRSRNMDTVKMTSTL